MDPDRLIRAQLEPSSPGASGPPDIETPTGKQLTCRHWKLLPVGCIIGEKDCKYAHHDTGTMSPPSTMTCWAWKNGGCKYHEDACLFAHVDTGLVQTNASSTRHRHLTYKHRAIAKAAALAGFDCSDLDRLMSLVNAVQAADTGTTYPDFYRGTSNLESSFSPARERHRKGGLKYYRDLDNPAVPAFTFTSDQLLRRARQSSRGGNFMGFMGSHVVESNSSRQTINVYNKRTSDDRYMPKPAKKLKVTNAYSNQHITIDLTQDEPSYGSTPMASPPRAAQDNIHPSRRANVPGGVQSDMVPPISPSANIGQRRTENRKNVIQAHTSAALDQVANVLTEQMAQLSNARETLKIRWEEDRQLQLQTVTQDLARLNAFFSEMETVGKEALNVVQGRLMRMA